MRGHTFRVFVSSTFSDLKVERNALARSVFPRLRALCEARGYKFQAVDLRWGVRDEAGLDQQTVRICLDEIARCQRLSPRPNFLVLLGDRYGWCPPPSVIPADEMEKLREHLPAGEADLVFGPPGVDPEIAPANETGWYRRDDNAVPPEYVLQSRRGDYQDPARWGPVERRLREALAGAAEKAGLGEAAWRKYRASATELEIMKGAVNVPEARRHVFAFFRSIANLDDVKAALPGDAAGTLLDALPDGRWDREAWEAQQRLKSLLADRIGEANVWPYQARWVGDALDLAEATADLPAQADVPAVDRPLRDTASLCEAVWQRLSSVMVVEMDELDRETRDPLEVEKRAHVDFAEDRRRVFVGRREALARIEAYLRDGPARPLVVHGPSGSGKSALMARAAADARAAHPNAIVVERYIGAAPGAADARSLLESVGRELTRELGGDEATIPVLYDKLVADFPARLALGRPERPVMVFLDALDQLGDADEGRRLIWLPRELPPNVRLVVSTLEDDTYQCFPVLRAGVDGTDRARDFVRVEALTRDEGREILERWLSGPAAEQDDEGPERRRRKLTTARPEEPGRPAERRQLEILLEKFGAGPEGDHGSPLYLKLAFEEARRWHSYDRDAHAAELPADVPRMIRALFARLSAPSRHGQILVSRALAFLAAARYGLSDEEMLDLLWRDPGVKGELQEHAARHHRLPEGTDALPPVIWSRLYFDLEPYLAPRDVFGVRLLTFFHRQIGEIAAEGFLDAVPGEGRGEVTGVTGGPPAPRKAVHTHLADYFAGRWSRPETHALLELIPQLAAAGREDEVRALLLQYLWISTKLAATNVNLLLTDYDELPLDRQEPGGLVGGTIKLSSHVLAARPEELPGQLAGRLLGYREPGIHRLLAEAREQPGALTPIWSCLDDPGSPLLRTLTWHYGSASSLAAAHSISVSADGELVASGDLRGTVRIWHLSSGKMFRELKHRADLGVHVALSRNGRHLVSSNGSTVRVWDVATGRPLLTGEIPKTTEVWRKRAGQERLVSDLAELDWHQPRDDWGQVIAEIDHNWVGLVRIVEDGLSPITALALAARTVVWGGEDGAIRFCPAGQPFTRVEAHGGKVQAVAINATGRVAVSGSNDKTLKVWDVVAKQARQTLVGHAEPITSVAISGDGNTLVSAAYDLTVKIWDLRRSGETNHVAPESHEGPVLAVAASAREVGPISVSHGSVFSWDGRGRVTVRLKTVDTRPFAGDDLVTTAAAIAPESRIVVSVRGGTFVEVWDVVSGNLLRTWKREGIGCIALSADGRTALSGSSSGNLELWDLKRGKTLRSTDIGSVWGGAIFPDRHIPGDPISGVSISSDGRSAISAFWDSATVWDLHTGVRLQEIGGLDGPVMGVAIAPDSRIAATATYHGRTVRIWDVTAGKQLASFTGEAPFTSIAFSSDGRQLVAGDKLGRIYVLRVCPER